MVLVRASSLQYFVLEADVPRGSRLTVFKNPARIVEWKRVPKFKMGMILVFLDLHLFRGPF